MYRLKQEDNTNEKLDELNIKLKKRKFKIIDNKNIDTRKKFLNKKKKTIKTSIAKYDIDSLMSAKDKKNLKIKKPTSYLIVKSTAEERRKRIGL